MEDKDIENYKQKISNLNIEEQKLRDVHLKQMATGEIQGPPVGYSSIDKPWMRNFTDDEIIGDVPKLTCYQALYENNKDYLYSKAFEYLGKDITYGEFFKMIEDAKRALLASGVKPGEIVTVCSITTPEVLALFYALNRIGAVPNFIDVRYTPDAIKEYIKEANSKKVFTLDLCLPRINKIINEVGVDEVIYINPANTAPAALTFLSNLKSKKEKYVPNDSKYVNWNEFIKRNNGDDFEFEYQESYPAAIVHTGGTTGVPKGVTISNDAFNSVVYQVKVARTHERRGYKFLNIMPPFIAYGLGLGLYAPLVLGWETVIIPDFSDDNFSKLLRKHKPNGVMGVPIYWEKVMNDPKMNNYDLSFLKDVLVGGDKTPPALETRINEYLKSHNSNAILSKGYSMTEASSLATFSNKQINELGSVGIPLVKTTVAAFEPGTQRELPTGEIGELYIKSTNLMNEYFNNPEATNEVKQLHIDGEWIHTGDIGYVDEDGLVYVKDRIKRMIIRSGFKVFPSEIEKVITELSDVDLCAVVGIDDEKDVTAPKAYIVLNSNCIKSEDEIKNEIYSSLEQSKLPPYFKPVDIEIIEKMPTTLIGKVDYDTLKEMNDKKSIK